MPKPILISISPNTQADDVWLAVKTIFQPWAWRRGQAQIQLINQLKTRLKQPYAWLINGARNGLFLALKALNLNSSDQVLCQAFTCVAVPNAIRWAGAQPVFVDTNKTDFNLNLSDLKLKITSHAKALIIQHTFGQPDDLTAIKAICRQHRLILIEDCAHALGAKYQMKPVGSFGDITVLSFGRDKIISSVFGGAVLTQNQSLAKKIESQFSRLAYPSAWWIFKQLFHPIIFSLIVPTYYTLGLGKVLLFLLRQLRLISLPVTLKEKQGQVSYPPQKLPQALAVLALNQLNKLGRFNRHRRQIAQYYRHQLFLPPIHKEAIYLRFPILVKDPDELIKLAKKKQILLGNWYCPVIAPAGVDLALQSYQSGSCPNAENLSQKVVNLPTHPKMTLADANRVISVINNYYSFHDRNQTDY